MFYENKTITKLLLNVYEKHGLVNHVDTNIRLSCVAIFVSGSYGRVIRHLFIHTDAYLHTHHMRTWFLMDLNKE